MIFSLPPRIDITPCRCHTLLLTPPPPRRCRRRHITPRHAMPLYAYAADDAFSPLLPCYFLSRLFTTSYAMVH